MRYIKMIKYDVGNWYGVNATIFFSGCHFHCPGCFNKEAQDFSRGDIFTKQKENEFIGYANDKYVEGVCILGGEVFHQNLDEMLYFIKNVKEQVNKPIHVWTGYIFEDLLSDPKKVEILKYIDTIVDGPFIQDLKDLSLELRGSSNQRVIDVQKSLNTHKTQLL